MMDQPAIHGRDVLWRTDADQQITLQQLNAIYVAEAQLVDIHSKQE